MNYEWGGYLLVEFHERNENLGNVSAKKLSQDYAGFLVVDCYNNFQCWSSDFFRSLGFVPNEITPSLESWEKLVHPGDKFVLEFMLAECFNSVFNGISNYIRLKTKNNSYKLLKANIKPISKMELRTCSCINFTMHE